MFPSEGKSFTLPDNVRQHQHRSSPSQTSLITPNSIVEPLQACQEGNVARRAAQREQVLVCFLIGAFHTSSKSRPHRLLGARAADLYAAVAAMALRPSQGHTCRAGGNPPLPARTASSACVWRPELRLPSARAVARPYPHCDHALASHVSLLPPHFYRVG